MSDLRYALRRLRASPGFALAALATMALGIGANTAIFTIVNTLMLRPLPVAAPERLVEIYTGTTNATTGVVEAAATSSYPDYLDYRDLPLFAGGLAAYEATLLSLSDGGAARVLFAESATGNYFDVLGVRPTLGRLFGPDEDRPGAPPVAVLGVGFWERNFGADPSVVGRTLTLNGRSFTVIGVGPRDYKGGLLGLAIDLWLPMNVEFDSSPDRARSRTNRGNRSLFLRGRLAPGATPQEAQAALRVVASRLEAAYPDSNAFRTVTVVPSTEVRFHPEVDKVLAPVAALLMAVPGLVLLIACANIANLLLARASGRTREIAVRLSLGAGRGRLVRLLLTESVLLAIAGGSVGVLLAWWLVGLANGWTPPGLPIPLAIDLAIDTRVLWFGLALSAVTGVVFGLAPALQATHPALVPALKDEGAFALRNYRRFGLRNALVVTQLAVSLALLTAAGLFVRSLQNAQDIDPGFERERAIVALPALMMSPVPQEQRAALTERMRDRLAAIPGVVAVAFADRLPLGASVRMTDVLIDDQVPDANGRGVQTDETIVGPGYFSVLRIPLIKGRDFTDRDDRNAPRVAIVSEAFARRFWPNQDAIGRRVMFTPRRGAKPAEGMTVIAVARDTKVRTLGEAPRPYLYVPWRQTDDEVGFVVRTAGDPAALVGVVRRELQAVAPDVPLLTLWTMKEHLSLMLTPPRLAAQMLGMAGMLAILLASLGLYAVVAYTAARRTKEIGIRVALGATRRQVLRLVIREGMTLVAIGIAVGLAIATALVQPLGDYLYGVRSFDPVTFASVASLMAGTAFIANYLPARRAVRVDPLKAIRYE